MSDRTPSIPQSVTPQCARVPEVVRTAAKPALAGAILWPTAMASEPWEDEIARGLELSPSGAASVAMAPGRPMSPAKAGLPYDRALASHGSRGIRRGSEDIARQGGLNPGELC